MLWFVGLGISGSKSIPVEALEVLSKADIVYLEQLPMVNSSRVKDG
jgi:diphthamide biosynthesis methyltransferase